VVVLTLVGCTAPAAPTAVIIPPAATNPAGTATGGAVTPTSAEQAVETGLTIGKQAPSFSTTLLNGNIQSLASLRGKVVLINFWATWCGPCRVEMPFFQSLADTYGARDFVVLAINNREDAAKMQPFLDGIKVHFPVGLDQAGKINTLYEVRQYPTSFVIDRKGVILARQFGPFPDGAVQAALDTWLK
jgi:thiol-disulfide isomerase/thioredoxin